MIVQALFPIIKQMHPLNVTIQIIEQILGFILFKGFDKMKERKNYLKLSKIKFFFSTN